MNYTNMIKTLLFLLLLSVNIFAIEVHYPAGDFVFTSGNDTYLSSVPSNVGKVDNTLIFFPNDYNPVLWIDANDSSNMTEDVGISIAADKSGNAQNIIQDTDADQPAYNTNEISYVSGDTLENNSPSVSLSDNSDFTLFFVHDVIDPSTSTDSFIDILDFNSNGVGANDRRPLIYYNKSADTLVFYNYNGSVSVSASGNTGKKVITVYHSGTTLGVNFNGVSKGTATLSASNIETTLVSILTGDISGQNLPIVFNEIIYFNKGLSDSEISIVENYLINKWL